MNRITAEQALSQVGRQSKNTPLRLEILDLEPGEAVEVDYTEFDPAAVSSTAFSLNRRSDTRKFSVRKRRDGQGCFVICQPKTAA